jgi:hypothetical protein
MQLFYRQFNDQSGRGDRKPHSSFSVPGSQFKLLYWALCQIHTNTMKSLKVSETLSILNTTSARLKRRHPGSKFQDIEQSVSYSTDVT